MWWQSFVGWTIVEAGDNGTLVWALLTRDAKRALILQRTYRWPPTKVFYDVSDEDLGLCRTEPWSLWNSERGGTI